MSNHQFKLLMDVMQSESRVGFGLLNNLPSVPLRTADFAAKRLNITAQGLALGLVWVKGALKVAPDVRGAVRITRKLPNDAPRSPLSGRISRYA